MPARDYQILAAQSIWDYFDKHSGNPLVLMPTGTGKSHVIAEFLQSVFHYFPQQRVMILTHVKELIQQDYNKLVDAWPNAPVAIYSSGLKQRQINSIIFGGVATVAKKPEVFGHVDLLIIDEAHLLSDSDTTMYRKFIAALMQVNPYLKVIGFTATGWRLSSGKLTQGENPLFTDVCFDMTTVEAFNWLIAQGYLMPLIPKPARTQLDITGVHMRGGEFIQSELQNAVDKHDITVRALQEAAERGGDRKKWLIFASGVEHAIHIGEILDEMGIPAGVVHSKMKDSERDSVLEAHKRGEIRAIANNNILTTGYDDPEIDLILCLRPTASSGLWVQMLGRGTRPVFAPGYDLTSQQGRLAAIAASQKQNCLVLDYSGNTRRLGPINDPVIPSKKGKGGGTAPVKLCEACDTYNHASARVCFVCGAEFTFAVKIKQDASTAALIKGDIPIVENFTVDQVTYQQYMKPGKPPMLKVTYYCGLKAFNEYVCLEHTNFAGKKARDWWRKRSTLPCPTTVSDAMDQVDKIAVPASLRVWVNKQYPEILDVLFKPKEEAQPEVYVHRPKDEFPTEAPVAAGAYTYEDDDIPF